MLPSISWDSQSSIVHAVPPKKQKQKRILVWWASSTFGVLQETSQPRRVNICHELISQRVKLLRLSSPETENRPTTSDYVRPW